MTRIFPELDSRAATPPVAKRLAHPTTIHGRTREDDYFWLRDRSDADVEAYLQAEESYANAAMAPTEPLQQQLYDEILSHIKQTDLSVPYRHGAYWYYSRTEEGKQYPILARKREALDASEEITLDLNALAEGHDFLGLGAYEISDDGQRLAYALDTTGYRRYTLHVMDLRTREEIDEPLERVTSVAWATDNATLFYTTEDPVSKRNDRFWRRDLRSRESTLVYEEADELYDIATQRTNDGRFVFVASYSKATTEWRALRADVPNAEPFLVAARSEGHRYSVEHHGDRFYIVTNRDALDFRIVAAPDDAPHEENWTEIVPERQGVSIDRLDVFERFAVVRERSAGFENLEIFDFATQALRPVELAERVHAVGDQPNPEFHTGAYRFAYTSLVTPNTVYELDLATGAQTILKATEVPGYDAASYVSELASATSRDGTSIPVSLVYRRDRPRAEGGPLLLYAYGSYGISIDPTFSAARLALLDRGVAFAIAHIRGGGELGERWRTAGHLQAKLTTFDDFIDVAEFLIAERLTSAARLAIQGGSAGGLLVATVVNMRPELFRAAIAQVPFVDVLNTMLDASLPLTTSEYLEWGDPNAEPDFAYMARYSPYDNVRSQPYPALLVKVALNDSQVPYWEGAKLVARLRTLNTSDRPILLKTNFGAGHGGASGRYDNLRETALNYAFVLAEIGG